MDTNRINEIKSLLTDLSLSELFEIYGSNNSEVQEIIQNYVSLSYAKTPEVATREAVQEIQDISCMVKELRLRLQRIDAKDYILDKVDIKNICTN